MTYNRSADYWPQDNETEIWRVGQSMGLDEIIDLVQKKWPNTQFQDIEISTHHVHTHCLGYDLYDSSDYTDFVCISRVR